MKEKLLKKPLDYSLKEILINHWKQQHAIHLRGWIMGQYTHDSQDFIVGFWPQTNQIKLQLFINTNDKFSYILFANEPHSPLVKVEYHTTKWQSAYIYGILKFRYLTMDNKHQWDLRKNNLHHWLKIVAMVDSIQLAFLYQGSHIYDFFQWPHEKFDIYLLVKDKTPQYFVIKRKKFGLHWIIIDLNNPRKN